MNLDEIVGGFRKRRIDAQTTIKVCDQLVAQRFAVLEADLMHDSPIR